MGDVAVDDPREPTLIQLRIKQSKTDPFRLGVKVVVGSTGTSLCPVAALLDYLRSRGTARRGPVIQIPGWSMPHEAAVCRGVAGGPVGGWNRTGKVLQPQLKDRRGDDGGQKRDGGRRH